MDGLRPLPQGAGVAAREDGLHIGEDGERHLFRRFRPEVEPDRGVQARLLGG